MSWMQSDVKLDGFVASLSAFEAPPELIGPLLGVWYALRGEWQAAHGEVQGDTVECSWVHAALHREEGDHRNAEYWYRRAGRPMASGEIRAEYLAIAAALTTG